MDGRRGEEKTSSASQLHTGPLQRSDWLLARGQERWKPPQTGKGICWRMERPAKSSPSEAPRRAEIFQNSGWLPHQRKVGR